MIAELLEHCYYRFTFRLRMGFFWYSLLFKPFLYEVTYLDTQYAGFVLPLSDWGMRVQVIYLKRIARDQKGVLIFRFDTCFFAIRSANDSVLQFAKVCKF